MIFIFIWICFSSDLALFRIFFDSNDQLDNRRLVENILKLIESLQKHSA